MNIDQIEPAVEHAQRMQELKDIAEWKHRRMVAYHAWSEPLAVAERRAKYEEDAQAALERGKTMAGYAKLQMDLAKEQKHIEASLKAYKLVPILKIKTHKASLWQRLIAWFK